MGCCGGGKVSKCGPDYTKRIKNLQNKISTLIRLKGGQVGVGGDFPVISYSEECPKVEIVREVEEIIDHEYKEYYRQEKFKRK